MKKKNTISKIIFIAIIITNFVYSGNCFSQTWQWAISGNGASNDYGGNSCTDASGNVIITGNFSSSPLQMGTITLNNSGNTDSYVAKVNPHGTILWAQKIGGTGFESIGGVSSDAIGNIYVSGSYNSPVINLGTFSAVNFTNSGTYDIFVACFNSSGVVQWFKSFGGAKDDNGYGCAFSNSLSSLYIGGNFHSTTFTAGTNTLTNSDVTGNKSDIFLARLTNTGVATWAKATGSPASDESAQKIAIDSNSDPYFNGYFSPTTLTTTIGTTLVTSYGGQDMLLVKYNSAGTPQWVKNYGSTINCSCDFAGGLSIDASNNIFLSGTYTGASLVAGTYTLTNSGGYDTFAAKTNSLGIFQWVSKIGGLGDQYSNSLTNDAIGNVFVTGSFSGTNVVVGTTTLTNGTPGTSTDVYVLKYNNLGTVQWALSAAGANTDEQGNDLCTDATGNIYISGQIYTSPTTFGTYTVTNSGATDLFLAKISCLTTSIGAISPICSGSSATLTASGATSYTWSNGSTGSPIIISPTISTTYSVVGAVGTCTGTGNTLNVAVLPASINAGPDFSLTCAQKQLIPTVTNPTSPISVVWTPTNGLSNPSILTPSATAGALVNNYTVTATLSNGCVVKDYINVSSFAPTPQLCMVTVDSLGINNEIYWDKTMYSSVDSFIVYREISSNVYKRIIALDKNAYSMFTDTCRSIGGANNGDPKFTSYKYKLQLRDSCGNYSSLSYYHQTMFLQDQQNGNFNWNAYAIESSASPVSNYVLNRRNLSTGATTTVAATTANLITDPLYSSLFATNIKWFVDAQGFNCNPTFKISNIAALKTRTKSNQSNEKTFPTILQQNTLVSSQLDIYPNPTNELITISFKETGKVNYNLELKNVLGQTVISEEVLLGTQSLNVSQLNKGIYFLNITQNSKLVFVKKIIIE